MSLFRIRRYPLPPSPTSPQLSSCVLWELSTRTRKFPQSSTPRTSISSRWRTATSSRATWTGWSDRRSRRRRRQCSENKDAIFVSLNCEPAMCCDNVVCGDASNSSLKVWGQHFVCNLVTCSPVNRSLRGALKYLLF